MDSMAWASASAVKCSERMMVHTPTSFASSMRRRTPGRMDGGGGDDDDDDAVEEEESMTVSSP